MKLAAFFALILWGLRAQAPAAQTGTSKIENFTLVDAASNKTISLADFAGERAVVVVFTSNYCPYARLYEDRIISLSEEYAGRSVQFLLVNSNTSMDNIDDSVEEMARHAKEKGYRFPYLADKEHRVAEMLGATKTPEAFVLQNNGTGSFVLKYRGAIDDNPQVAQEVTVNYLRDAITATLNRRNISIAEKRPTGCMIKRQ
jgi:peroxiredoxin